MADDALLLRTLMKQNAGLADLPTPLTYDLRLAVCGEGPRAYDWSDKPHRLLYDACGEIERMSAGHTAAAAERIAGLEAENARLVDAVEDAALAFQHYGDLHAAKPDKEKAECNYKLARKMRAALRKEPRP